MSKSERDPNGVTTWAMVSVALDGDEEQEVLADEVGGWFEEDPLPEAEVLETRIAERMKELSDWTAGRIYWALMRSEGPINAGLEREQTLETGIERLESAQAEMDPQTPVYWRCMRLKAQLIQIENPTQAIALFEQIRTCEVADPEDAIGAANSLANYMAQNDLAGAIELLESTLEKYAEQPENRRAMIMLNLANFKAYAKDITGATLLLSQVLGMKDLDASSWGIARLHFAFIVLMPARKMKEARAMLTEVVEHESVSEQLKDQARRNMPLDPDSYRLFVPGGGSRGEDIIVSPDHD